MGLSTSGRTWEDASSPAAVRLVRRFEIAWRSANGHGRRPDPDEFLPGDADECPGVRLALLRADLGLRREAGEKIDAEWYRDRYRDLDSEALVALIYEEFCLREEDGESPDPADFLARFPEVDSRLRRVFDIHGLVGSGQTTALHASPAPTTPFPEAGQTIAGFHLVEELGRGAFARVFLAEERQLADRPVALKVARAGSREPQTLARLQHTHIVPVHSTRTDPATGLHLLCMPYFGRVTLASLLADPKVKVARSGAELVEALDRLAPSEAAGVAKGTGRAALAGRSYAIAIAWWGARMAEALAHAHDRGVLHRDVKPSNVLVTGDGMPMLLDFNLARESVIDETEAAQATLGGTLDYMAPEHLEALADGDAKSVDIRSDVYSLGVVLYEALVGTRPFPPPRGARSAIEMLVLAADARRDEAPRLRVTNPEVPAALEAIVRRCLAPEPDDRYASAGDLAHDLQAVADDLPLKFAREPFPSRASRWVRRNRRVIAMAAPVVIAIVVGIAILEKFRAERQRFHMDFQALYVEGQTAEKNEDYGTAVTKYETAARLIRDRPRFVSEWKRAREGVVRAGEFKRARDEADALFRDTSPLRFRLTQFLGGSEATSNQVKKTLQRFHILQNDRWTELDSLTLLDQPRRYRLIKEVNEILFLWVVAKDRWARARDGSVDRLIIRDALKDCDRALLFAKPGSPSERSEGPWRALRAHLLATLDEPTETPTIIDHPATETSALACFQWGLLRELEKRHSLALAWLTQAVLLEPSDYWYQHYLAYVAHKAGRRVEAFRYYEAALALEPDSPWARFNRGCLYRELGEWDRALSDLERAVNGFAGKPEESRARLERGLARQFQGDLAGARADYAKVIEANPKDLFGRAARLNRARLDAESGDLRRAGAEYDALLDENPDDPTPRISRAMLALREDRAKAAEADLDELVRQTRGQDSAVLADRALARLILNRPADAERDAASALRLEASPSNERLWTRTLLALGRARDLRIESPDMLVRLPVGSTLMHDLRSAAHKLKAEAAGTGANALRAMLTRAMLLSALHDTRAEPEADRAVALAPLSAQAYLTRAYVRRARGARAGALSDVRRGLELQPDNPHLWELRGLVALEAGDAREALVAFDRALKMGAGNRVRGPRAEALLALGDTDGAVRDCTLALAHDPEDPQAYFSRGRALLRQGHWDQALADFEQSAEWSGNGQPLLAVRIALASARSLSARPDQLPRVLGLARRALSAVSTAWPSGSP